MATQLFLRNAASPLGGPGQKLLSPSRGAASTGLVTNTVASGNDLQVTQTAGGQVLEWLSGQWQAGTISGSISVFIRGLESATAANAGPGVRIDRTDAAGNVLSTILALTSVPAVATEWGTTDTSRNGSFTPSATSLTAGQRIKVTLYVRAVGTMGGARTVTNSVDGPTAGAAGDTYVTFTENLTAFSGVTVAAGGLAGVAAIGAAVASVGAVAAPTVLALAAQIPTPPRAQVNLVKSLGSILKPTTQRTTVLTLTAGAAVGNRVMVAWGGSLISVQDLIICDDTKGNTYVNLRRQVTADPTDAAVGIFTAIVDTALVAGDTITVTQPSSSPHGWLVATEWSGLTVPALAADATGVGTSVSAGPVDQPSGGAFVGVVAATAASHVTPTLTGSGWTQRATGASTSGTPHDYGSWDQGTDLPATRTFNPTLSGSATWAAALVAMTAGTDPPTPDLISSWVGGIETDRVVVTAQTTLSATIRLLVSTDPTLGNAIIGAAQTPDSQGYTRHSVAGLASGTVYYFGLSLDGTRTGFRGNFTTPAAAGQPFSFSAVIGSCTLIQNQTGFTRAVARDPTLGVFTGDIPYIDISSNTPAGFRSTREALFTLPDFWAFVRGRPVLYTWSDHDFGANNANSTSLSKPAAQTVYRQTIPHHPLVVSDGIYHAFSYGRARFILTDNRSYKSVQANTDNSSKTVLGATQKQWFKDEITNATERVIFWVNEQPWVGAAVAGDDEWSGYDTERTELANHLIASGKVVICLSGDMHAVAYHNGSGAPGRTPVFHAAPWAQTGSQKGGPYTQGPYSGTGEVVNHYGLVEFTDAGQTIKIRFRGFDTTETTRVDATLSWVTPTAIGGVAAMGAPLLPRHATVGAQTLQLVADMPAPDVEGTSPSVLAATIAATSYLQLAPDITPPTVPVGLSTLDVGPTDATLGWQPSTDAAGVARYELIVWGPAMADTLAWGPPPLDNPTTILVGQGSALGPEPATINLTTGQDYVVRWTGKTTRRLRFAGAGRNLYLLGGAVDINRPHATLDDRNAIWVDGVTGTIRFEGIDVRGAYLNDGFKGGASGSYCVWEVLACRLNELQGTQDGYHCDGVQPINGWTLYRMDKVTIYSQFQGGMLKADGNHGLTVDWRRVQFGNYLTPDSTARLINIIADGPNPAGNPWLEGPVHFGTDTYVAPRPGQTAPSSNVAPAAWFTQSGSGTTQLLTPNPAGWVGTNPTLEMDGVIKEWDGTGEFMPAGSAGLNYVPPGYVS